MSYRKLFIIISLLFISNSSFSQLGEVIKDFIIEDLEKRIPDYLESQEDNLGIIDIQKFNVRKNKTKLKGVINIDEISDGLFKDDIRIKSKLNYKPNENLDLTSLKIHFPGDKFLFFRRYKELIK